MKNQPLSYYVSFPHPGEEHLEIKKNGLTLVRLGTVGMLLTELLGAQLAQDRPREKFLGRWVKSRDPEMVEVVGELFQEIASAQEKLKEINHLKETIRHFLDKDQFIGYHLKPEARFYLNNWLWEDEKVSQHLDRIKFRLTTHPRFQPQKSNHPGHGPLPDLVWSEKERVYRSQVSNLRLLENLGFGEFQAKRFLESCQKVRELEREIESAKDQARPVLKTRLVRERKIRDEHATLVRQAIARQAIPIEQYSSGDILAICYLEVRHCIQQGLWARLCSWCGAYFILTDSRPQRRPEKRKYCYLCQRSGPQLQYQNKLRKDESKAQRQKKRRAAYMRFRRGSYQGKPFLKEDFLRSLAEGDPKPHPTKEKVKEEIILSKPVLKEVERVLTRLRRATPLEIVEETNLPWEEVEKALKHYEKKSLARALGDPRRNQWEWLGQDL